MVPWAIRPSSATTARVRTYFCWALSLPSLTLWSFYCVDSPVPLPAIWRTWIGECDEIYIHLELGQIELKCGGSWNCCRQCLLSITLIYSAIYIIILAYQLSCSKLTVISNFSSDYHWLHPTLFVPMTGVNWTCDSLWQLVTTNNIFLKSSM